MWVAFLRFAEFVENKSRIGSSIREAMKRAYKEKSQMHLSRKFSYLCSKPKTVAYMIIYAVSL